MLTLPVGQTEIQIDKSGAYFEQDDELTAPKKLAKAEITLNDCLACSGCITSAESVLVSMQSHEELYRVLEEQPVSLLLTTERYTDGMLRRLRQSCPYHLSLSHLLQQRMTFHQKPV